ncbi:transglutaminase family protein [Salinarimonas ramus]|uniref:Transglutaminase n=1 Tax=Salinarimonas ramus TaxID=690164 RepID=A0A917Q8P8_9HYPH|nr:transglutaminase family protein [Salinarimonas ramus]GGK36393.1 transglutaminase [Salinarimonas ramus]
MRIRIEHETTYTYEEPARGLIQILRLTPRPHVGQHVVRWRIEPSLDGALRQSEDALGNIVHRFAAETAEERLTIRVTGEVETHEAHGVVRGLVERAPDLYFLRTTEMTTPSEALATFAEEAAGAQARTDPLAALHALNTALCERMTMRRGPAGTAVGAAEAFEAGRGLPQDVAHAFVAGARHLGIPARNVSGYLYRGDDTDEGENADDGRVMDETHGHVHAWAEALAPRLGWVAFDPSFGVCAGPAHVRVAMGLDAPGCVPVRGARYGGGAETLSVRLVLTDMRGGDAGGGGGRNQPPSSSQSQSQS